MRTYRYAGPSQVTYGLDAMDALPEICGSLTGERILLVTTSSLAQTHLRGRLEGLLGDRCVGVLSDLRQHVPASAVSNVLGAAHETRPDLLVTLGGGSVTDAAKAISAALVEGYTDSAQIYQHRIRFTYPDTIEVTPFNADPIPIVSIPTTLSAAEYDGIFGMTSAEGVKDLYSDPRLTPHAVILDPRATELTPERLWLASGIRALDHAVEIYLSASAMPVADAMALNAIRLLSANLSRTKNHPDDMSARLNCLVAAWLSMFGVSDVTLGLSHGIGHQLGGLCGVPHGETSCVILPVVLDQLREVVPERLADIGKAMGRADSSASVEEAAAACVDGVRQFISDLGLPTRLRDVNVERKDLRLIAGASMEDMVVASAPVTVSEDEIHRLLERAW